MPKIQKSLPDYQALVRWTVQDVINWLHDNKFDDCVSAFRQYGVDGNKFVHSEEPDLVNIGIKRAIVREIMEQLNTVGRPKNNSRGGAPVVQPPSHRNLAANDDSEDEGWGSDEFEKEESDEPGSPVAPPRPNRAVPARNGHRDPPPPSRQQPVMASEFNDAEEVYEDPDEGVSTKPPQITTLPPTTRTNQKRGPVPIRKEEPVAEELYEDPDNKPSGPPIPSPSPQRAPPIGKRALPAPPPHEEEENYADPDSNQQAPPPPRARVKAAPPPYTKVNIQDKPKPPSLANLPSRLSFQDDTPDYLEPEADLPPPPPTSRGAAPPPRGAVQPPRATLQPPRGGDMPRKTSVPAQEEETYEETTCDAQEDYEEPDVVEPPKRGGLPPLGNNASRAPPLPVSSTLRPSPSSVSNSSRVPPPSPSNTARAPPPSPSNTSRAPPPSPSNTSMGPPPVSNSSRPPPPPVGNTSRARPPLVPQETYEEPDAMTQEEVYEIPEKDEEQEQYLAMEHDMPQTMAPVPTPTRTTPCVPSGRSRAPIPAPIPTQAPAVIETPKKPQIPAPAEEDYENEMKKLKAAAPKLPGQRVLPPPPSTHVETPAPLTTGSKEPTEAQLQLQKWYHGSISRDAAKEKLFSYDQDGMYLIRKSTKNPAQPFTLQIYFAKNDFNLPIRKNGTREYQVGSNTQTFPSLLEIVNTFKKSRLVLNKTTETTLVKSLPKT